MAVCNLVRDASGSAEAAGFPLFSGGEEAAGNESSTALLSESFSTFLVLCDCGDERRRMHAGQEEVVRVGQTVVADAKQRASTLVTVTIRPFSKVGLYLPEC